MQSTLDVPAPAAEVAPPPAPGRRLPGWLAVVLPTLVTAGVVSWRAAAAQPWRDEIATWSAASRSVPEIIELGRHIDGVMVPYYLLMHVVIDRLGDAPVVLRLPSMIAMTLTATVVALLGRRLYGPSAGLLGGLVFAVVPAVSRYGQEARGYALATLFAVLATLLLIGALERGRWWRWLGYGVGVLLLGWSHEIALLLLTGHGVAVFRAGGGPSVERRRRFLPWPASVLLAAAGVLPLALLGLGQRSAQLNWLSAAQPAALADLPATIFLSGVAGGAVCATAAFALRRPGWGTSALWLSVLLPVAALYAVDQLVVPIFVGRYLLFVVPLICVLAGGGLAALRLPTGLAVVLLTGLIGLPVQQEIRRTHSVYDYRGVARLVAAGARPGDAIVYAPRDGWQFTDLAMDYYLGPAVPDDVLAQGRTTFWTTECADPAACLAGVRRVWVVRADVIDTGVPAALTGSVQEALTAWTQVTRTGVSGFSVTLLSRS